MPDLYHVTFVDIASGEKVECGNIDQVDTIDHEGIVFNEHESSSCTAEIIRSIIVPFGTFSNMQIERVK